MVNVQIKVIETNSIFRNIKTQGNRFRSDRVPAKSLPPDAKPSSILVLIRLTLSFTVVWLVRNRLDKHQSRCLTNWG